jgi:cobalt-precorrin-5B (C1)-methyltransferase
MKALAEWLHALGADDAIFAKAGDANTANEVLEMATAAGLALGDLVARRAREVALATVGGGTAIEVAIFDRQGRLVGRAGD